MYKAKPNCNNKIGTTRCDKEVGFLFDLDGVLIDSETEYTRIWSEINDAFPTGIDVFAIKIKGMTLPEILHEYFPDTDVQHKVVDMLNSMEQRMRYRMLPGADELLGELNRRGMGCVMVTSSNNLKMLHLREEQPTLESKFRDIVTADRITHSKPDPEGYLLGASILGLPAQQCVVFEDSAQGVKAGHASGAYTVGLTTTLPATRLESYCDRIVGDLSEIDLDELIWAVLNRRIDTSCIE